MLAPVAAGGRGQVLFKLALLGTGISLGKCGTLVWHWAATEDTVKMHFVQGHVTKSDPGEVCVEEEETHQTWCARPRLEKPSDPLPPTGELVGGRYVHLPADRDWPPADPSWIYLTQLANGGDG